MDTVYKVVLGRLRDKKDKNSVRYTSAITPEVYEVEYLLNKKVIPAVPGSALFAFANIELASQFMGSPKENVLSDHGVLRIFKCSAAIRRLPACYTLTDIDAFWRDGWYNFPLGFPYVLDAPEGTVLCDWIQLKEEVGWDGRVLKVQEQSVYRNPRVSARR